MEKNIVKIIKQLQLEKANTYLEMEWEESEKSFSQENIFFLQESYIREQGSFIGFESDDIDECLKLAAKFRENNDLLRYAWHEYYLINISPDKDNIALNERPCLKTFLGKGIFTYNLLLIMASIPTLQKLHNSLSIPKDVSNKTIKNISFLVTYFKLNNKITGLGFGEFNWTLTHAFKAKEFTIGRLRYELCNTNLNASVYKNIQDGRIIILANSGLNIGCDGLMYSAPAKDRWKTTVTESDNLITGHTCYSDGRVDIEKQTIDTRKWKKTLTTGDPCLGIHISAGPNFTLEACLESLQQVEGFMGKCFPEHKYKGLTCHTWFFDINFQTLLSPDSKILQFQQQFFLTPNQEFEQLKWVFGKGCNRDNLQRKTSMQKIIAEFIENAGYLRGGAGFMLKEDIHKWGSQIYNTHKKGK